MRSARRASRRQKKKRSAHGRMTSATVTFNHEKQRHARLRLQRQLEYRLAHREPGWRGRELHDRAADVTREPLVGERDRMRRMDRRRRPAARRALVAAYLEQIGEIGLELQVRRIECG